jgi:hypothetical protein
VDQEVLAAYLGARDRALEARLQASFDQEQLLLKRRLEQEAADRITPIRRHIINKILTLACPRCTAAFVDFDGCLALTCARPGCRAAFCGICMHDCDRDAHRHVAGCKFARGAVFGTAFGIKQMQNAWRAERVKEALLNLTPPLKANVLASLRQELADVGLDVQQFS